MVKRPSSNYKPLTAVVQWENRWTPLYQKSHDATGDTPSSQCCIWRLDYRPRSYCPVWQTVLPLLPTLAVLRLETNEDKIEDALHLPHAAPPMREANLGRCPMYRV